MVNWKCLYNRNIGYLSLMKRLIQLALLLFPVMAFPQASTVNWTNVHQQIDGFGAADTGTSYGTQLTSTQQSFFFGTGSGQLGLSILRVGVPNNAENIGNCITINTGCAGASWVISDMQAVTANGGKIYGSIWAPPAPYTVGNTTVCQSGNSTLATGSYANYATYFTNYAKSVTAQGVSLFAVSIQNEPDICQSYDSSQWTASTIDTFVKTNLGPTFSSNSISTLIFEPEASTYSATSSLGATCGTDSACNTFVGGYNWHEYGTSISGFTVSPNPVPSGWASGKRWWETEASCGSGFGPSFCQSGFNTNMTDALNWASVVDQRMQDGANAWLYWLLVSYTGAATTDDQSLMANAASGFTVPQRAYMLGQYSKFVRPGYYRIDATHAPQSNVTISCYQNTSTTTLVCVAENYSSSSISQTFNLINAPTFTTVTPTITSSSQNLATQSPVSVSSNSFTYPLPAQSVTTFVGTGGGTTYTLSTSVVGSGTISGCARSYASGASYSCTVTPSAGYTISSVTGCGGSGTTTYAGSMPASNCTVTATFTTGSQLWTGLLAPNRAPNSAWPNVGAGAIPSRTTICQTLGVAGQTPTYVQSVTYAQIFTALQACAGTNETVYMNPGTYNLTASIGPTGTVFPSNVTLRGGGPQQTILKWTSGASFVNCNGLGATAFCIYNSDSGADQYAANVLTVTSAMSQGATSVTLGGTPGNVCGGSYNAACPGSISNLQIGTYIEFVQGDLSSDNGNWYTCGTAGAPLSCSQQGSANSWAHRGKNQMVRVTGISGSTVTFTPGIYAPNWSLSQTPYATFSSTLPVTGVGVENLQINTQNNGDMQAELEFWWAASSWVKNVAFINNVAQGGAARKHIQIASSAHITVRDSYFFGSSPSSEGYGVDALFGGADSLIENNIFQHIASGTIIENGTGNVFGYNFAVDNFYTADGSSPNWQQCDVSLHDEGDEYNLWEGHEGICAGWDDIHGTSIVDTMFRSYLNGADPAVLCPGGGTACGTGVAGPKNQNTEAVQMLAYTRYANLAANVFGTSGFFSNYKGKPTSTTNSWSGGWNSIYQLGWGNQQLGPDTTSNDSYCVTGAPYCVYNDLLTDSTSMYWGNYDTVNGSIQTNSGETASGASTYPGLASPSTSWSSYPSFYLSSQPSWWIFPNGTTAPWPGTGPDITSGNISGVSGHAYLNPAANCFYNVLGGVNTGASPVLAFDANNCYASSGPPQAVAPSFSPVSPYSGPATTITLSSSTPSPTIKYCQDNTNTCTPSTTGTSVSFSSTGYIRAFATATGYTQSTTSSWQGTIATGTLTAPTFSPNGSVDSVTAPYFLPASFSLAVTPTIPAGTGCYTLTGTAPTAPTPGTCGSGSTTYTSGAISVAANQTLKMLATGVGSTNSAVTSATYNQRNAILESICSFNGGNSSITTGACTLSPNPSAGDGLTCGYAIGNNTSVGTISDNAGGIYLVANQSYYGANTFAASGRVYRTGLPGGTVTVTLNLSSAASYTGFGCEAYKPSAAGVFTLDTAFTQASPYPNATVGNSASPAVASAIPTNANEIVYGQVLNATYTISPTAGSGFTIVNPLPGSPLLYPEYQIQSAATATTLPFSLSATDYWQEQPTAFYFQSSGPPPPTSVNATLSGANLQ